MKVKQLIKSISSSHTHTHTEINTHTQISTYTHSDSHAALPRCKCIELRAETFKADKTQVARPLISLGWLPVFFYFFFLFLHSHPLIFFPALHLALQFFYAGSRSTKMQLNAKTAPLPGEQQTQQPVALLRCCS